MASAVLAETANKPSPRVVDDIPIIAIDTPVIFEDEGQEEMGDSAPHSTATEILHCGIEAHLEDRPEFQVYVNLNLYYHPINRSAYASPDVMVVAPYQKLPDDLSSYRMGEDGPAPVLVVEVLSPRTAQQGDLTLKPKIYADSKIAEYILVDVSAKFLKERLLLRSFQEDGSWLDFQDEDGGVTSALGFRIIIEDDAKVRVLNVRTGRRYVRPREADRTIIHLERWAESEIRLVEEAKHLADEKTRLAEEAMRQAEEKTRQAEEYAKALEAEIARLRAARPSEPS